MKILWAKANKLLPLHSGGDIRSFHILKHLSKSNDVTFLSYYDGPPDLSYDVALKDHLPNAVCVSTGKSENAASRAIDYLWRLPSRVPYAVRRFASTRVQEAVKSLLENKKFDVAVCDFLDAAINLPADRNIPAVLFQHNVESEIWRRHADSVSNPFKRQIYQLEHRKMLRYEQDKIRKFQHVIAVSDHDRSLMQQWTDPSRITVVPTGVDVEEYRPSSSTAIPERIVMFVGAMDWEPNIDAVEYFYREIWNAVIARVPEARFVVVGRNPDRRVKNLASNSIEVTGRVPSVVEYLHQAAVVVVPLRIGGGTRLKIYEAMAAAKAVVSTTVGAEGLDVHDGSDIVIADEPQKFADCIVQLIQNRELRRRYENAAFATASQYDWSIIAAKFASVLQSAR